jgi:aryl-alcohol dehydrogenase-like predicted oxidoreductase
MKYNELGKTGVLVSELCLGTMTFGGRGYWTAVGQVPQDEVNEIVKLSVDSGINFIDTANAYSEGLSETMLGAALQQLGIPRQQLFIATKVRLRMGPGANQVGLSRLHIIDSVNDSLERMGLSHIDLLYIHGVDPLTPLEETMRGLEEVVRAGKVRYLGISNHPAWMVMKANGYSAKMGWNRFVASQNYYTIASRDIERELVPMALSEDIGIMPWSPLAGGFLSGKYTRQTEKAGNSRRDQFDFPPIIPRQHSRSRWVAQRRRHSAPQRYRDRSRRPRCALGRPSPPSSRSQWPARSDRRRGPQAASPGRHHTRHQRPSSRSAAARHEADCRCH